MPLLDLSDNEDELNGNIVANESDLTGDSSMDTASPRNSSPEPMSGDDQASAQVVQSSGTRRATVRDTLVFREIHTENLPGNVPSTCEMIFEDPDELHQFEVAVSPREGYWRGGRFLFQIVVPDGYNFEPPKVKCLTKLWHPNITVDGAVCLSILRSAVIDGTGWNPARQLRDVVFGIHSLFTDLVNFIDPLNEQAAIMFREDPYQFKETVKDYIQEFARPPKKSKK